MKIGFYIQWPKMQYNNRYTNYIGDEQLAESLCRRLRRFDIVDQAELYAPNCIPKNNLDIMVYLNNIEPTYYWAKKNIIYLQNGYGNGSDKVLKDLYTKQYDGFLFVSDKLLHFHKENGYNGLYLPFGVDTEFFFPREISKKYSFDVSYVGNDIKGEVRTNKYLLPAINYNFGLFGNWEIPKPRLRSKLMFWRKDQSPSYRKKFSKISKGKIAQEDLPILYSSAKINLNCTLQDCVDWDVITLRTFEILACKGFLITDRIPLAEKTMNDCMIFSDGNDDLVNKIQYYLNESDERKKIAENGFNYVINNATIEKRADSLIEYLEKIV
jgi:spore maturation protein CgeB